jgi:diguanylate cyclase (GGDEF)-like protein
MHSVTELAAFVLLAAGIITLAAGLLPLRQIVEQLPPGATRRIWLLQGALTVLFIAGYCAYGVVGWGEDRGLVGLIVPAVFFLGACFVKMNFAQALRTALDMRRIALLEQENITDHLTGVYNRRYLQRRLLEEFERARRYKVPLAILLLDIDHFKRINDERGHAIGDLALRHFGTVCLNAVRASDVVARYGGEELLVIAPHTTASQSLLLAERLRQRVESSALVVESEPSQRREVRFTVSVGVAALQPDDHNCGVLFERADRALYCAKSAGRNRVSTESCPAARALGGDAPATRSPATRSQSTRSPTPRPRVPA